ncbi:MAG: DUF177 domain-containing protein [Desulfomonilia bacterium]|jgi:uncharacterized protein
MDKVRTIDEIKLVPDTIGEAGIEKDLRIEPGTMMELFADKDIEVTEPFDLHYEVARHHENIHVSVDIKGNLSTTCSRCMSAMEYPVDLHLESDYMPAPPEMSDHLEAERLSEETGYFRKEIKLGEYIISELVLSLPFIYICTDSCKGLCPHCGANLNDGPCACTHSADPGFQVLLQLKKNSK